MIAVRVKVARDYHEVRVILRGRVRVIDAGLIRDDADALLQACHRAHARGKRVHGVYWIGGTPHVMTKRRRGPQKVR